MAVDRARIRLAARLLTKAGSTDAEEEAIALALRAYSLTAEWLNACDEASGFPRRRERRLLRDRRNLRERIMHPTRVVPTKSWTGGYEAVASPKPEEKGEIDLRL